MTKLLPDKSELWQTLRLSAACALAWGVGALLNLEEVYWALITTVVVTKPLLPQTIDTGRGRMIGSLIGAAIGFLVVLLVQHGWPRGPLFCMAFLFTAVIVAKVPGWRLSAITLIVVVLIPSVGSPYWRPFDRVVEILIGTLAATAVAAVSRPRIIRALAPSVAPDDDRKGQ